VWWPTCRSCGRGDDACDKYALRETEQKKEDGRDHPRLRNCWQRAERCRDQANSDYSREHRALAAVDVGVVSKQRPTGGLQQQRYRESRIDGASDSVALLDRKNSVPRTGAT
jgi:hypothetical protein